MSRGATFHAGRHYLVTGAAGGIGSAVAGKLAAEGACLSLVDVDEEALDRLVEALVAATSSSRSRFLACVADVADPGQVEAYAQRAEAHHGPVDGFLNNAAIEGPAHPIEDYPVADFDRVFAINVRGVWLGMKYVIPIMSAPQGSIVIMSSVAGTVGSPNLSPYVASKHAVIGIMRSACLELGERGIRVNTIHPGLVNTAMARRIGESSGVGADAFADMMKEGVPLGRLAEPADVASMVAFLFSEEAAYCNGSEYFVDGGMRAGR